MKVLIYFDIYPFISIGGTLFQELIYKNEGRAKLIYVKDEIIFDNHEGHWLHTVLCKLYPQCLVILQCSKSDALIGYGILGLIFE